MCEDFHANLSQSIQETDVSKPINLQTGAMEPRYGCTHVSFGLCVDFSSFNFFYEFNTWNSCDFHLLFISYKVVKGFLVVIYSITCYF